MAEVILIVGDTGTGKSSSIRTLVPEQTVVINVLDKSLPFMQSRAMYNKEKGNIRVASSAKTIVTLLNKLPEAKPDVKHVILDDLGFVMQIDYFNKSNVTG